jgi:hypothetical protein
MAKGNVTTENLVSGMKSFGGLSSLGGAPRPARDNPFRDTRAEPVQPVASVAPVAPAAPPEPAPDAPRLEVINGHEKPGVEGAKNKLAPRPPRAAEKLEPPPSPLVPERSSNGRENKTDLYTERVTLLLNAELRDGAEALAKQLHRSRTQKGERITANTVIRVALRVMLERLQPTEPTMLNTEEQLYEFALKRWPRK